MGDARWSALLGSWFIGLGVLRYRHIQRGKPLKITESMMHAICHKGKQKTLRAGFYYAIRSMFLNGWDWTAPWLEAFQSLFPAKQSTCGLCFDSRGSPWSLHEVTSVAQLVFRDMFENHQDLTSYSWRRLAPSMATLTSLSQTELLALGDWQDKSPPTWSNQP